MSNHLSDADLLLLLDGGLQAEAERQARAHLPACAPCLERWQALSAIDSQVRDMDLEGAWVASVRHEGERTRLEGQLVDAAPRVRRWAGLPAQAVRPLAVAAALLLLAVASLTLLTAPGPSTSVVDHVSVDVEPGALPLRHLTPGATMTVPAAELCRVIPLEPAPIPAAMRTAVLRAYGMEHLSDREYELDYLVTPDLGGSPEPRNLWPEPYGARVWNARVKDELESLLPQLVCEGKVDLATAQRDIASDWIAAYKKYFNTDRPVRLSSHARSTASGPAAVYDPFMDAAQ